MKIVPKTGVRFAGTPGAWRQAFEAEKDHERTRGRESGLC